MTPFLQTVVALAVVAVAATWLIWNNVRKKKQSGCASGGMCGAVSPEVKALQAKLKK